MAVGGGVGSRSTALSFRCGCRGLAKRVTKGTRAPGSRGHAWGSSSAGVVAFGFRSVSKEVGQRSASEAWCFAALRERSCRSGRVRLPELFGERSNTGFGSSISRYGEVHSYPVLPSLHCGEPPRGHARFRLSDLGPRAAVVLRGAVSPSSGVWVASKASVERVSRRWADLTRTYPCPCSWVE